MSGLVTYAEQSGLYQAITNAGYSLWHVDGKSYADDPVAVQAIINGYAGSATELAWYKQLKLSALGAQYNDIINGGRLYSVTGGVDATQHKYQVDEVAPIDPTTGLSTRRASQDTITSMGAQAKAVLDNTPGTAPWSSNFKWMDWNNVGVPMTAAQCYAFTQNVAVYVETVDDTFFTLRAQINAATTVAAVDAIDVTQGWPSNP